MSSADTTRLRELAGLFLKLGTTAFGGPAAHIALMETEVVRRRQWLTHAEFLDLLGLANLIPGPSSTELAIFIGHRRAGWRGLLLAGLCFILPAALIVTALAAAYVRYGHLPAVAGILYGLKPVIIAIILQALCKLAPVALKNRPLIALALAALVLSLAGVSPLVILFGTGLLLAAVRLARRHPDKLLTPAPLAVTGTPLLLAAGTAAPFTLPALFLVFLKIGAILFGSGYLLLAFFRTDLVIHLQGLTENQLLDAVAVGQFTPGPVFTTATFIGYILGGPWAAFIATIAIFLPSFVLVAISGPLLPHLRRSPVTGAFLDGVNAASLALLAAVTWQLGRSALVDWPTAILAVITLALLLRHQINTIWLILTAAFLGWLLTTH